MGNKWPLGVNYHHQMEKHLQYGTTVIRISLVHDDIVQSSQKVIHPSFLSQWYKLYQIDTTGIFLLTSVFLWIDTMYPCKPGTPEYVNSIL